MWSIARTPFARRFVVSSRNRPPGIQNPLLPGVSLERALSEPDLARSRHGRRRPLIYQTFPTRPFNRGAFVSRGTTDTPHQGTRAQTRSYQDALDVPGWRCTTLARERRVLPA